VLCSLETVLLLLCLSEEVSSVYEWWFVSKREGRKGFIDRTLKVGSDTRIEKWGVERCGDGRKRGRRMDTYCMDGCVDGYVRSDVIVVMRTHGRCNIMFLSFFFTLTLRAWRFLNLSTT
jgi:hypothetical protein